MSKASYVWSKGMAMTALLLSICFTSCDQAITETDPHRLQIVTTTGMIRDGILNIVGDSADVTALMGPGVDPHLYKASYGDLRKLRRASVIVYNGLHLEGKMAEVFEKLGNQKKIIAVSAAIKKTSLRSPAEFEGNPDPHIWFNVYLWRNAMEYTGNQLMQQDTLHAAYYKKNLDQYLKALDTLDQWVKNQINSIPAEKRVLVTAHDAFGYFGDAYHMEVKGLQGISTLADFGLNDISSLVNMLSSRKIKAVFVESSVPRKSIDAVVEGCRDRGHQLVIGGTLFSDAMGSPGTTEDNYIGMVRYNVNAIVHALK